MEKSIYTDEYALSNENSAAASCGVSERQDQDSASGRFRTKPVTKQASGNDTRRDSTVEEGEEGGWFGSMGTRPATGTDAARGSYSGPLCQDSERGIFKV